MAVAPRAELAAAAARRRAGRRGRRVAAHWRWGDRIAFVLCWACAASRCA